MQDNSGQILSEYAFKFNFSGNDEGSVVFYLITVVKTFHCWLQTDYGPQINANKSKVMVLKRDSDHCTTIIRLQVKRYSSLCTHLRATGRHLPCGTSQCYLPLNTGERTPT